MITYNLWKKFINDWNDKCATNKYITESFIINIIISIITIILDIIIIPLEIIYLITYKIINKKRRR